MENYSINWQDSGQVRVNIQIAVRGKGGNLFLLILGQQIVVYNVTYGSCSIWFNFSNFTCLKIA